MAEQAETVVWGEIDGQTITFPMEVGDFDLRTLLQALAQNPDLNLGSLGDLILGQGGRN